VVEAERRLDLLPASDGLINATYADTRRFPLTRTASTALILPPMTRQALGDTIQPLR
jgi:hypothetical protein